MPDDIIKQARDQFDESDGASDFNRKAAHEDIRFSRLSDQWPDHIKKQREQEGRPCLTINKMPAFIRQVVNDARQNKPGMKISPVDNGADADTAEVIGGLCRSIERHSNADIAYDTAIDNAVSGGFGFFRIGIDYAHEESFDLECQIHRIPNPLSVHWDTNSTEFDSSDWMYGFVGDDLTQAEFKKRYPKASPVSFDTNERDQATSSTYDEDMVRISEYWSRDEKKRKLVQLSNGVVARLDEIPKMVKTYLEAGGMGDIGAASDDELVALFLQLQDLTVQNERDATYFEVTRRMLSGADILEEEQWPGSTIPICPVWGEEVVVDGRRYFRSMIRDAKDPQTMFNFWRTAATELVALAPKAPFIMEETALPLDAGERNKWANANTRSYPYLMHNKGSNQPKREPFAGVPAGALQEALSASDDMKAIIGIYDSSLGARSNETSGRAIMARQREADVSNFHFIDNLNRAIRAAGQILVEVIPSVYSARDTIRILGEDSKEEVVQLARQGQNLGGINTGQTLDGEPKLYDLSVGRYDVTVSSGPSYQTQREETREFLLEMVSRQPDMAAIVGDKLIEHMDFPGADVIAKRLQAMLPPQIQQAEGIAPAPGAVPGQQVPAQPGSFPQEQPPIPEGV